MLYDDDDEETLVLDRHAVIQFNRRHCEFMKDYNCISCDFFHKCADKIGFESFSCPLDDITTPIYSSYVSSNFADLCDVVKEPTKQEWDNLEGDTDAETRKKFGSLEYVIIMPKCKAVEDWEKTKSIQDMKTHFACRLTINDLRAKMKHFKEYDRADSTDYSNVCCQLIRLVVPMMWLHLL